jgi:hypothetical protein
MPVRWIPLVVPFLALLIVCDTFLIGWAILAMY